MTKIRSYFYGIQQNHFYPSLLTYIAISVCFTIGLMLENPEARVNFIRAGFIGLGILGLKK